MNSEEKQLDTPEVAQKAVRAVFWNYLSFGSGKFLLLLTTAILARLLTVEEFGTVGFAVLVVTYLTALKDLGLGSALIQKRGEIEKASNTVFTLNILLGVSLALITYLIAPGVALFFRDNQVESLLPVLGLTFIFNGIGNTHRTLLRKDLSFKRKFIPDLARSLSKGLVSIVLALAGAGVWSLVIGQVASSAVGAISSWLVYPWKPKIELHPSIMRGLFGFGATVLIVDMIAVATDNLDYLVIGRALGNADLAIYTMAYRLPELLILNTLWILASVLFPTYAIIQKDRETLRQGFLTSVRYIELVVIPLSLGLAIAADPIVRVVFGPQWLAAIPILRILALFALVNSIAYNIGDVYKAIGRPDVLVKIELVVLAVLIPGLIFLVRFGVIAIALGHLVGAFFHLAIRLSVTRHIINVKAMEILKQLQPALLAGAVLTALAWPVLQLTPSLQPVLRLILVATAGAFGYLLTLWITERQSLLAAGRTLGLIPDKNPIQISTQERES
jgi:PST family polysaccharide transporter